MHTLRQYLLTLADSRGLTRTLGEIDLCRDAQGKPLYTAGNSAAVFRIRHGGRIRALRCYLRPGRHLREIYGEQLLERELFLYDTPTTGSWVDVVLCDWIEGETLRQAVRTAAEAGDRTLLAALAAAFDRLAAKMVADDCAHGDLKPENIIVTKEGGLHPIDFDALFLPTFTGEKSPELGTAAFQHPGRTAEDFDSHLDDYPAALISTALHALALDPSLYTRHAGGDGLLFSPRHIATNAAYREVLARFSRRGMAVHFRIAELLTAPTLRLHALPALLDRAVREAEGISPCGATPELFEENGRWGYRTPQQTVVPPLYDCGFDFTEGLAAVQLGDVWHYIDTAGRTVVSCPGCQAVKPFRGGRAIILRDGRRMKIDRAGNEFAI